MKINNQKKTGFTLLEIMIVVAIVGAIAVLGLPRIRKNKNNIRTITREIAGLSKEIRNYARLKNSTYRIVFQLNGGEKNKPDTYFIEAATGTALALSSEKQKLLDELPEDERPKAAFQKVDKPLKKDKELPSGLYFAQIQSKSKKDPVRSGTAYIHYSPEGLVEHSIIQITDGKNLTWSLIINPLTGHAEIADKAVELKDVEISADSSE